MQFIESKGCPKTDDGRNEEKGINGCSKPWFNFLHKIKCGEKILSFVAEGRGQGHHEIANLLVA